MDGETLALIRSGMSNIKAPASYDKVFKDEAMLNFDTPFTDGGLYVNMATWYGFGEDHLMEDAKRTGNNLYLHCSAIRVRKQTAEEEIEKVDKLAIGVSGGFLTDEQKYDIIKSYQLCVLDLSEGGKKTMIPYPSSEGSIKSSIPEFVSAVMEAIMNHQGNHIQQDTSAWENDDERPVSKYALDLEQLPLDGRVFSNDPSTWKCEDSGMTENLWLNLSTGYIGSGRRNYDGSGGTGAALKHFESTGNKYPLCVKLGTITPQGADVYSYAPDEDCMVTDPNLAAHLAHFGIDITKLEKTDKTIAEQELEMNKSILSTITESGSKLTPLSGSGYVGLKNLGNSCYMNSVLQVLNSLDDISNYYLANYDMICNRLWTSASGTPYNDLLLNYAKVTQGLLSDRYTKISPIPDSNPEEGIPTTSLEPRMFKAAAAKTHYEFSTGRQQDAQEYLGYLLGELVKVERKGVDPSYGTTDGFFQSIVEDKFQCTETKQVKCKDRQEQFLSLNIPLDKAINQTEVDEYVLVTNQKEDEKKDSTSTSEMSNKVEIEEVKPLIPFEACLSDAFSPELMEAYYSPALGRNAPATKTMRIKQFPRYCVVQLRRYTYDMTGVPKKLEVLVPMPDELDLSPFKAVGILDGEVQMEDTEESNSEDNNVPVPSPEIVAAIEEMGFSTNAAKRACLAVNNSNVASATDWIFQHMDDPDLNEPLPTPQVQQKKDGSKNDVDPEIVANLTMLGFPEGAVKKALRETDNNPERAADWLFSHPDEQGDDEEDEMQIEENQGTSSSEEIRERKTWSGKYRLKGFISHVGSNFNCGHYVAHIKKDGEWAIFDDSKVAKSEDPPLSHGYLYFYEAVE